MNAIERSRNGHRDTQRVSRAQRRTHAPAQIAGAEIFHDEIRVLVAHAQVIQPHDARVTDALNDFIFLQEARERRIELVLGLLVARHFQHHERARLLALGQVELGHGAGGEPPHTPVAANERLTEFLRFCRLGGRAPRCARLHLLAGCIRERIHELVVLDLRAVQHAVGAEPRGLLRLLVLPVAAQEDDRREARTRCEILQPLEATAPGPLMRQQHAIEPLREKLRRRFSTDDRARHDELRVGPSAREVVPDKCAIPRIVFEQQQPHGARRLPRSGVAIVQAAKVAPFAAGNEATIRKRAAGRFFQVN